ncbi:MAG TPA: hypothetical protein VFP86_03795 [bacterium]|nr:hypothetical protein [bacterium]
MQKLVNASAIGVLATAVLVVVLAWVGVAVAQPAGSDLSGHWIMTITVTQGNSVDQARLGQGGDLSCGQSGTLMTCWSRDGNILLGGARDGAAVQMKGRWEPEGIRITLTGESEVIRMTLDGRLVNPTLMQGYFDADITVGLGDYKASGEWRAMKAGN